MLDRLDFTEKDIDDYFINQKLKRDIKEVAYWRVSHFLPDSPTQKDLDKEFNIAYNYFASGEDNRFPLKRLEEIFKAYKEWVIYFVKEEKQEEIEEDNKPEEKAYGYKAELDNRDGFFFTIATTTTLTRKEFYDKLSKKYDMETIRIIACNSKEELEE